MMKILHEKIGESPAAGIVPKTRLLDGTARGLPDKERPASIDRQRMPLAVRLLEVIDIAGLTTRLNFN
jgi:hypothetical protein